MPVPFKQIPPGIRVPLFYAELDNSMANTSTANQRTLIIGQITSSGTATPNVPIISAGPSDAKTAGGQGSQLALMTAAYRANDSFGEVWYLPLADDGSAVAAAGNVLFTQPATAPGVLSLYVAGQVVSVPLTGSQTVAQIATATAAAINAVSDLPVTAAVDGSIAAKVNLTAKNKGLAGNDIDLRVNYGGSQAGQALPPGLTYTITPMAGGLVNPSLTLGLAALLDMPFDFIVCPYTDTISLNALSAFLNDATGRWSWQQQVYGHVFAAQRGTFAGLTTFGVTRNDQHASVLGFNDSPSPNWIWAAAYAGASASSLRVDPGLPLQTVPVYGVLAPPLQSRFNLSMRNTLLYDGISTFTVGQDGVVRLENIITTYQTNGFGQPDNSYLEVESLFLLAFVLRSLMGMVTSKYARVKLASNGTRVAPGSNVVTPATIKGDLIAKYQELEAQGYVQNSKAFAAGLIVQQNGANRIDVLWPGTLIGQLRIFALLAQFRLM